MTLPLTSPNSTSPPPRPRRSWTLAEQAAYLADFAASGLSATAFCRRLGIRRATLARWRARAGTAAGATARRPARPRSRTGAFAAVTVVPDAVGVAQTRQAPAAQAPAAQAPAAQAPAAQAPAAQAPAALAGALTLVLRGPSGVTADVAGLDLAAARALLRALWRGVLTPPSRPGAEALG